MNDFSKNEIATIKNCVLYEVKEYEKRFAQLEIDLSFGLVDENHNYAKTLDTLDYLKSIVLKLDKVNCNG